MDTSQKASRILVAVGLFAMIVGAIDPLEGSVVILAGVPFSAIGAYLGQTRHRKILYWATAMVAIGVAALFTLSAYGGIGGKSGHSWWWAITMVPYPIGWVMGIIGSVSAIKEFYRLKMLPRFGLQ